jgi:hypothetical protein
MAGLSRRGRLLHLLIFAVAVETLTWVSASDSALM